MVINHSITSYSVSSHAYTILPFLKWSCRNNDSVVYLI